MKESAFTKKENSFICHSCQTVDYWQKRRDGNDLLNCRWRCCCCYFVRQRSCTAAALYDRRLALPHLFCHHTHHNSRRLLPRIFPETMVKFTDKERERDSVWKQKKEKKVLASCCLAYWSNVKHTHTHTHTDTSLFTCKKRTHLAVCFNVSVSATTLPCTTCNSNISNIDNAEKKGKSTGSGR